MTICTRCNQPSSKVVDGKLVYLRCHCDWGRGYAERLRKTIHAEFRKPLKTIKDWDPPLFASGFMELMEVQKLLAVKRIKDFAYGVDYDRKAFDINLNNRNNLFIRGPAGSGRGLLLASIKIHAAIREVTVTPIPCDYDIFRADFSEAEALGHVGEEKRIFVSQKYQHPQVMTVENVRAEVRFNDRPRRIKGAQQLDAMMAKRLVHPGIIVVTSYDFVGEILDSMGDRMFEVLNSPRTKHILLFSPEESLALEKALYERKRLMLERMEGIRNDDSKDRKMRMEKMSEDEQLAVLEDALFFEEAFRGLKTAAGYDALPIQAQMEMGAPDWAKRDRVLKAWQAFVSSRKDNDVAFKEGIRRARIEAVRGCKGLANKMTEGEMLEAGRMLSHACLVSGEDEKLAEWKAKVDEAKNKMTGTDSNA